MADLLMEIVKEVQAQGIQNIYRRNVERVLAALQVTTDFWKVVDYSDLPVPYASAIIKALAERGLVKIENDEILLTEKGWEVIREYNIGPYKDFSCEACQGRGVPFYKNIEFYRTFVEIAKDRPEPVQQFDQGAVTPETTVSRVLHMDMRGDIEGKEIIVMGAEDDLTGLAIALYGGYKRLLIIDIDERLIEFDNKIIKELGLKNVEARVHDLRNPYTDEFLGKFDVFVTDPPETFAAFKAFIARGIATIKDHGGAGYFGLTLRDSSIFRWQKFQKELLRIGAVITDIIQDFNDYMNWGYHEETKAAQVAPVKKAPQDIWYRSAWYRIELLPGFERTNEPISDEVFYLDEEGSTT